MLSISPDGILGWAGERFEDAPRPLIRHGRKRAGGILLVNNALIGYRCKRMPDQVAAGAILAERTEEALP